MADPTDPQPSQASAESPFGPRPRTVAEALAKALDFPERAVSELLLTVNEALLASTSRAGEFHALGFGHWTLRPYRPANPMLKNTCYGWDPTEVPNAGPLVFEPSAALLRQLDEGRLNTQAMFTCTPLVQTLIQRTGVPQAQAAQVMRLIFITFTDLLLVEGFFTLPGFGTLMTVRRPTKLVVDTETKRARPVIRKWVRFHGSEALINALPTTHRAAQWDTHREPDLNYASMLAKDRDWWDLTPRPSIKAPIDGEGGA